MSDPALAGESKGGMVSVAPPTHYRGFNNEVGAPTLRRGIPVTVAVSHYLLPLNILNIENGVPGLSSPPKAKCIVAERLPDTQPSIL